MIIYQCNRCKKIIDEPDNKRYDIVATHNYGQRVYDPYDNPVIHLCPDCEKAFDDFLEGKEVKSNVLSKEIFIGPIGGFKD